MWQGSYHSPPSLSLSICLSLHFPREKPDSGQSVFSDLALGSKGKKAESWEKSSHSHPHNTLFMKPHVLLLFKSFSQHRELHPVLL